MNFVDLDWKKTPFQRPDFMEFTDNEFPCKPEHWEDMVKFAKLFAKDIPFLRVDMYEIEGQIYISEFTFYPGSGTTPFSPQEWEEKWGDEIKIEQLSAGGTPSHK